MSAAALPRGRTLMRAAGFAALATFSTLYWVDLVADPPLARAFAVIALATLGGAAIAVVGAGAARGPATIARLGVLAVTIAATLAVMGLSPRLMLPGGWDELGAGVDRASAALRIGEWPYDGADAWIRLGTLLIVPVTLTAAAALAFWPTRRWRAAFALAAAGLLVGMYGAAIAEGQPRAPIVSGLLLLAALAAWLLLPRVSPRSALAAASMLLIAAAVSVFMAARLPATTPVIDYNSFSLGGAATFNWDQTYGPLRWSRKGQEVAEVESRQPHYWKATTLDRFDGYRWMSSTTSVGASSAERPANPPAGWQVKSTVVVHSLASDLLLAPGAVIETQGLNGVTVADDGTASTTDGLQPGDAYTVRSYAPDPTAEQMQAASSNVRGALLPFTAIVLPADSSAIVPSAGVGGTSLLLPGREDGSGATSAAVRRVLASPYGSTYRLARRLGASAPTNYDAVVRIEHYLRTNYEYSEKPPARRFAIPSFLFRDRIGYCQQFSGAMALMLRMNGIPARVAAGFAPGARQNDGSFSLRDLDAHSWVEVWFNGLGWIPFDPTPAASPAARSSGTTVTGALGAEGAAGQLRRATQGAHGDAPASAARGRGAAGPVSEAAVSSAGTGAAGPMRALGAALAVLACVALARWVGRRRTRSGPLGEIGELRAACGLLGVPLGGTTLAQFEARLTARGHDGAALHVRRLRQRRYEPRPAPPLERRGRRELRRALSAGRGPLMRLRSYLALPPRLRG